MHGLLGVRAQLGGDVRALLARAVLGQAAGIYGLDCADAQTGEITLLRRRVSGCAVNLTISFSPSRFDSICFFLFFLVLFVQDLLEACSGFGSRRWLLRVSIKPRFLHEGAVRS